MSKRTSTWLAYGGCILFGASAILCAQLMRWPPALASSLEQVAQRITEYRAEVLFQAKTVEAIEGSARINVTTSCIASVSPCRYAAERLTIAIDGDDARLIIGRYFDRDMVPAGSIDEMWFEPCQLTSEPIQLSPMVARRMLRLLSLPGYLDFRSMTGNEPSDTAETHLDIVVNGRKLTASLLGPESAPKRIDKLIELMYTLSDSKRNLPHAWPQSKKCKP